MFGWFRAKCPVGEEDRLWIEHRMEWLAREFGPDRLLNAEVVLPTDDFFPDPYRGLTEDVRPMLDRVCRYMDVDPSRIELGFYSERKPTAPHAVWMDSVSGTVGLYEENEGRFHVWLEIANLSDPASVAATLAHELGHVRLLGEKRVAPDVEDQEPLTDLLTVALGLGVLSANSVIRESHWEADLRFGWGVSRQGYLTAPLFGYALALFAWRRGEDRPPWARHLRLDVRAAFRQSLRYLGRRRTVYPPQERPPSVPPGAFRPPQTEDESPEPDPPSNRIDPVVRGSALAYEGELVQAIEWYGLALKRNAHDGEVYQLRGAAWIGLERFADALADAETALQLDPENIEAHRVRGDACLGLGDYATAVHAYSRVLKEEPEDAKAYYCRGLSRAAQGEHRLAIADYGLAIRYAPTEAAHYLARSGSYDALDQPQQALADRDEAEWRSRR